LGGADIRFGAAWEAGMAGFSMLVQALAYALGAVAAVAGLVYVAWSVYRLLALADRRYPKVWLLIGLGCVFLGVALEYLGLTPVSLLMAVAGLLLLAVGAILWWPNSPP
jgi:hypothetical protein